MEIADLGEMPPAVRTNRRSLPEKLVSAAADRISPQPKRLTAAPGRLTDLAINRLRARS